MPGGDGTGPMGMGPQTGRAEGFCSGNNTAGFASAGRGSFVGGRGRGMRRGNGMGGGRMRSGMRTPFAQMEELSTLKQQETALGGTLEEIKRRIEALENSEK